MTGFDVDATITGLQEAQEANLRKIAALKPSGSLGRAIQWGAGEAHRFLTANTAHWTGALRASRRIKMRARGLEAVISAAPEAINPRSDARPSRYDVSLHRRGQVPGRRSGILASMPYTVEKAGPRISKEMSAITKEDF